MSEFRKVESMPTGDDICINISDWDKDSYYVIIKKSAVPDSLRESKSMIFEKSDIERCSIFKFLRVNGSEIIFRDMSTEMDITINVMNPISRAMISIYEISGFDSKCDENEQLACKIEWFKLERFVFDRNFFKIGHAYKIKLTAIPEEPPVYALLKNVTCEELQFIWINIDNHADIKVTNISARKYNQRNPKKWFFAIDPDDKWADEIKELNKPLTREGAPLCDHQSLTD